MLLSPSTEDLVSHTTRNQRMSHSSHISHISHLSRCLSLSTLHRRLVTSNGLREKRPESKGNICEELHFAAIRRSVGPIRFPHLAHLETGRNLHAASCWQASTGHRIKRLNRAQSYTHHYQVLPSATSLLEAFSTPRPRSTLLLNQIHISVPIR
jgi:hypothetical protein